MRNKNFMGKIPQRIYSSEQNEDKEITTKPVTPPTK